MLFPLLILLALLVTPATLSAQSIPLSGIITDSTSGDVLIGASVRTFTT